MIYLLKSIECKKLENGNYETFFVLKIGYTEDETPDLIKNKRLLMYYSHHRSIELLTTIANGTEEQEKKLHHKFKDLRWDGSNEWYLFDQSIVDYVSSVTLEELDKLPNNPIRGDQRVLKGKREARFILSYLFNTKEDIDAYLANLSNILGDTISFNTSLDYIMSDPNINQGKLNYFLEIIERKETNNYSDNVEINQGVIDFMDQYEKLTTAYDRLKFLCTSNISKEAKDIILNLTPDSDEIKSYYISIGPDRLHELGYNVTKIKKELGIVMFNPLILESEIYFAFKEGDKLPLSSIKAKLASIYKSISYDKTPKAVDLLNYFEVKKCKISTIDNKRVDGYELTKKLFK